MAVRDKDFPLWLDPKPHKGLYFLASANWDINYYGPNSWFRDNKVYSEAERHMGMFLTLYPEDFYRIFNGRYIIIIYLLCFIKFLVI